MRIVHLSSSDIVGGAARAAFRLHKALLKAGDDSLMLVASKSSTAGSVWEMAPLKDDRSLWAYLLQTHYIDRNRTELSNTYFSLGWPGLDLAAHPLIASADVLHLHWVANFLAPCSIARLQRLGKPVVWTLHDQRAFTGGCHYSAGCDGFTTYCEQCPQLAADRCQLPATNLADQKRLWRPQELTIIALSRWMAQCVARSAVLQRSRVEIIPNSIETDVFVRLNKARARERLGWPPDAFCLLFGADYAAEKRKGFRELLEALKLCQADEAFARDARERKVQLACFGHPSPELEQCGIPLKSLGYVTTDAELVRAYAAANLFVLPSLEDNLPNTILEAMSCGTAVAAFDCGGVPDMVSDPATGRLAPTGDVRALSRILLDLSRKPEELDKMGRTARKVVEDKFTAELQTRRIRALYKELCSGTGTGDRERQGNGRNSKPLEERAAGVSRAVENLPCAPSQDPAGPGFQKLFPKLLQHALAGDAPDPRVDGRRRKAFLACVRRSLAAATSGRLSYPELLDRLGDYRPILDGRKPWNVRLQLAGKTVRRTLSGKASSS